MEDFRILLITLISISILGCEKNCNDISQQSVIKIVGDTLTNAHMIQNSNSHKIIIPRNSFSQINTNTNDSIFQSYYTIFSSRDVHLIEDKQESFTFYGY